MIALQLDRSFEAKVKMELLAFFQQLFDAANVCFDSQALELEAYRALVNALQNVLFET